MSECRFIIGTVNQGKLRVGDIYSAYKQNTIFLSGLCSADSYLDEPFVSIEARTFLKNIGEFCLELTAINQIDESSRIAELKMSEASQLKYQKLVEYLFRDNIKEYSTQQPPLMTLTPETALRVGDQLCIGYLSVLEPKGEGQYILKHDYPIERTQGPRYETYSEK